MPGNKLEKGRNEGMARDEKMKTQLLENCKDVEVGTTSARRDVY